MHHVLANVRRAVSIVLSAVFLSMAGACAARDDAAVAHVDGRRVAYRVLGSGAPVLVMISGLGDGMETFEDAAAELSKNATVIIYDRAGYDGSEAAPGPRDARAADKELSGLLAQIGVPGPYVLIGHSVGGLFAEYFAARHPDQIAGLILEDSRPADFTRRCEAARVDMCAAPKAMMIFAPVGARGELEALAATATEVEAIGPAPGKSVLVLSRPVGANAAPFDALWSANQDDLAARYVGARHLTAISGGHYVHLDQNAWFISSVREFLASAER